MVRIKMDGATEVLASGEEGLAPMPPVGVGRGDPTKVWGGERACRLMAVVVLVVVVPVVRCVVVVVLEDGVEEVTELLLWLLPLLS